MRLASYLCLFPVWCFVAGCGPAALMAGPPAAAPAPPASTTTAPPASPPAASALEVPGKTQCVPGRRAIIAPVPLHPVVEVLVLPGDRVKRGQVLVRLDDDEPEADLRTKEVELESGQTTTKELKRELEAIHTLYVSGATSEAAYYLARTAATKAEANERAAQTAVDSAKAELEHYAVAAPIDGVVAWLDVARGTVSRPGTTVWGEIMDLSEIDVRCDLTPAQADRVAVGQAAEVRKDGGSNEPWAGKVVLVGIAADEASEKVPVVVRIADAGEKLRCHVPVRVRFATVEE
jgi:RND family efflux transporter MFP subunit